MRKLFLVLLLTIFVGCTSDFDTEPKKVGQIATVDSLIQKEINTENIPGAVIQIKKGDSILHRSAYGHAQKYDYGMRKLENPEPMTTGHLFDVASLTKVMATTFGVMKLVDEDALSLDDPIHNYLPQFEEGDKSKITVRHLLTHSSGLAQWVPTYYHAENKEERYQYITNLPLRWEVGEGRHYSDLGFMLLADIIEKISDKSLDEFLENNFYQPLHLKNTGFNPLDKGLSKIAATSHGNPFEKQMVYDDEFGYNVDVDPKSWDGWREYTLRGEVNDGNAWYANGGVAGHAGLFSTVDDLQVLVDLLMNKEYQERKQFISKSIVDTFLTKDQYGNGLGWAIEKSFIAAEGSPDGTFGHTGFTGTNIVVVPQDSLSIIFLTNRQNVGRQEDGGYFDLDSLRQSIFDSVWKNEN